MKANKSFKLSKSSKMMMASSLPPHSHEFKRAMIQAELAAAIAPKREKRPQGNTTPEN
jgi:hypothetical protein